jgi:hypothetical protein
MGCKPVPIIPSNTGATRRVRSPFAFSGQQKAATGVETVTAFGCVHAQPRSGWNLTLRCCGYFREVLIELKVVLILPPMPLTAAMITSDMPAAIRPYSIAVAPDSSSKKRTKSLGITKPLADEGSTMTARNCKGVKSIVQKPYKGPPKL